jgi:hypothetical protein
MDRRSSTRPARGTPPLAVPHFATPFVGRLTERRVLTDALADAVRGTARLFCP